MGNKHRSGCPLNLTLEVLGDKWSLLILRDIMFGRKRHFRELMRSEEGISSNVLADRLKRLVEQGLLTRADDPTHKQKALYSLTEQGIELLPVLAQMAVWGRKYLPVSEELGIRAQLLDEGGPALWDEFMSELREAHLAVPARQRSNEGPSVTERLQAAYEAVAVKRRKSSARRAKRLKSSKKSSPA